MVSRDDSVVAGPFSVAEIAALLDGEVEGDGATKLEDVRSLADAGPEHLSFLANPKYVRLLAETGAGAVLIDRRTEARGRTVIRCDDPYAAFARALALFHPQPWPEPGVDPLAAVADDAVVDGATIEAFARVGPGAHVGPGSWVECGAYVGRGARIGERCRLMPHSVVYAGCTVGNRVWLNPGAVLGGEGFGFAPTTEGNVKIPQVGRVVIEDDVEIGSNSCADRATMGETIVRRGAKLDNLVQIAHGTDVGEHALLAAYAATAGSARIGSRVMMAGRTGVINHVKIGDGAQLSVGSIAVGDQPAGARLAGVPAIDSRKWLRASAAFAELPEMLKRIRALERRIVELERRLGDDPDRER